MVDSLKLFHFFILRTNENSCKVEVNGKTMNLGDGEGYQIPCQLHFTGDGKYIDNLKDIYRHYHKLSSFFYFFPIF